MPGRFSSSFSVSDQVGRDAPCRDAHCDGSAGGRWTSGGQRLARQRRGRPPRVTCFAGYAATSIASVWTDTEHAAPPKKQRTGRAK